MTDGTDWARGRETGEIDLHTDRPHSARVYDALLGGKTNYRADREAAAQALEAWPDAQLAALANRAFMHRAVRYLAAEAGVRQFLDIGTGIPTSPNLHEVAQGIAPESRVVYTDNDPIVLVHSQALHTGTPQGATAYVHGDLTEPSGILDAAELRATLDLSRPVALTLLTVLHWLPRRFDAHAIVRELLAAVPSGSYLAISHATDDFDADSIGAVSTQFRSQGSDVSPRGREAILAFFDGLELVDPGLTLIEDWRPEPSDVRLRAVGAPKSPLPAYVGVARKP